MNSAHNQSVSVIMNCLNGERYVRQAIDSVYAQTCADWEIVFWDNASTDGTASIAKEYGGRLRYFRGEKTVSLGEARNRALANARGEFIGFLDCDDLWRRDKIEKQMPLFDDPQVGLVFSDVLYFNEAGKQWRLYGYRRYWVGDCFKKLVANYYLSIGSVLLRRSALQREPYWFDPRFHMVEEAELFTRIAHKWKLAMIDEPVSMSRVHGESWSWKKGALFPHEKKLMLENYARVIPDFTDKYAEEIDAAKQAIAVEEAQHLWKNNDRGAARKTLSPYIVRNRKALLLYLATVLPAGPIMKARYLLGGIAPSSGLRTGNE